MKIEIERKFLLASDGWRTKVQSSERIRDGLLFWHEKRKAQVRIIGNRATLTIKTSHVEGAREEFEYDIPIADAERLIEFCGEDVLEKLRNHVQHDMLVWEVDEYDGFVSGVALAEVELESLDQPVELPDWVGPEVTQDPAFRKVNLLRARQRGQAEG
jgi:adenylate cyclase